LPNLDKVHGELVARLAKPGEEIMKTMTPQKCHLLHMAMGIAGEVGEVVDLVKKMVFYDKVIDTDKFREEMGDVEFYMRGLRDSLGITKDSILNNNITKLDARYSSGSYSNEQAINRADENKE